MRERWDVAAKGLPRLDSPTTLAIDLETRDPGLKTRGAGWAFPNAGQVVGYALAWGQHKMYLPVAHEAGGNLPQAKVERFVRDTLAVRGHTVIMHHRLYDEGWLRRTGIPVRGTVYDTGTAAALLDENRFSYNLDSLAWTYLQRRKNEGALDAAVEKRLNGLKLQAELRGLKGPARLAFLKEGKWNSKTDLWRMPGDLVTPYAEDDADLTLDLWDALRPGLDEEELWPIFELETRLLPILLEMRWRGVRVDLEKAEQTRDLFIKRQKEAQRELNRLAGFEVAVWEADSLARVFDDLGIPYLKTAKTQKPSFRKGWLEENTSDSNPIIRHILNVRKYDKTRSTFIEGYVLTKHHAGRIHGECHPLPSDFGGAVTGRFSMSNPNLENLPNPEKDYEMGKAVRELMLPEEGEEWGALDYSQQEPRLTVHFAAGARVRGAEDAMNAYIRNPKMDFHKFVAEITGLPRFHAKPINLGIGYGMGGAKLCHSLGLPTEWIFSRRQNRMVEIAGPEGQAILDQYHKNAPFIKGLTDECERRAKQTGWVRTLLGRRCRFTKNHQGEYEYTYKAMNKIVQGSAADQTKKAMIDLWDAGHVPLVPVHDELGCSVRDRAHAEEIAEIMINCVKLRVPCMVDAELGPSWGATVKEEAA